LLGTGTVFFKTDENVISVRNEQKKLREKKILFVGIFYVTKKRREQDPDLEPEPVVRIHGAGSV
jgi:hypothetical protein